MFTVCGFHYTSEFNTTWENSQAVKVLWALWISLYESQHLHTLISKMPEVQLCLFREDGHNTTFIIVLFTPASPF